MTEHYSSSGAMVPVPETVPENHCWWLHGSPEQVVVQVPLLQTQQDPETCQVTPLMIPVQRQAYLQLLATMLHPAVLHLWLQVSSPPPLLRSPLSHSEYLSLIHI